MNTDTDLTSDLTPNEPRDRKAGPVVIAVLVALVIGLLLGRFMWPTGDDIEVVEGTLGVVSNDLDAVALQGSNESYDLVHATGVECLDGLERGSIVRLGTAQVTTGDQDIPSEAFLNSPEATIVLWVECVPRPQVPAEGEDS